MACALAMWSVSSADADDRAVVRQWAESYSGVPGVGAGWACFIPAPKGTTLTATLKYEESVLAWPEGYRIEIWRADVGSPIGDDAVAERGFQLAHASQPPRRSSVIAHPPSGDLVNVSDRGGDPIVVAASHKPFEAYSARRHDFLLAKWLIGDPVRLESEVQVSVVGDGLLVEMPGISATATITPVEGGYAVARIDTFREDGSPDYSVRNSEFKRFNGLPQPVATRQEVWARSFPSTGPQLGRRPEGALVMISVSRLAMTWILQDTAPEVFAAGQRPSRPVTSTERPTSTPAPLKEVAPAPSSPSLPLEAQDRNTHWRTLAISGALLVICGAVWAVLRRMKS